GGHSVGAADLEEDAFASRYWDDVTFFALFPAEPEGTSEGHSSTAGRVRAGDGSRPNPSNNGGLGTANGGLRIEPAYPPLSFGLHPPAVTQHILGQPCSPGPGHRLTRNTRKYRRPPGPLRRDLDQGLGDEYGDGVQVTGAGIQSQPLRLQRN